MLELTAKQKSDKIARRVEYRVFINDASGADECCRRTAKTCCVVHTDLSFCVNSGYFPSFVQILAFRTSFCLFFFFPDTSSCYLKPLSCLFD